VTLKTTRGPVSDISESAIAAIIEERIKRGIYAPGSRVPAERVLAEEFGVSRRFVRSAYTRLIDKGLIEKSHYRRPVVPLSGDPVRLAHLAATSDAAALKGTTTIAAVVPSHPTFPGGLSIVAGIHKVLVDVESPYRLSFHDTFHKDRPEVLRREAQAIQSLIDDNVAGLIWWYYAEDDFVREVLNRNPGMPIVFIDRFPKDIRCDFAGIDDRDSSRTAVEYLLDLGHTRIAHLMDPGNYSTIIERAQGYREALEDRGIALNDDYVVHLDWEDDRMEKAFHKLFGLSKPPTALFTTNDFIAHEFIHVAESHGIKVPDDLSVVGHGNIDRYTPRPFLTSADQPFETIGRAAAKLLLKRLESADPTPGYQQIILQASLVVRNSCKKLTR
jgi:DNA-binding LacI/PurR family transcriptional regulator